jgi:hypothetical protein
VGPPTDSPTWQQPNPEKFRICDWERYDAQMRKLIGLD